MAGNVVLPFFGADPLDWQRPGLAISGSGNNFTSWLNKDPGLVFASDEQGMPGINYTVGDVLTVVGGTASVAGQITVDTVDPDTGAITGFHVSLAGAYSAPPNTDGTPVAFSGGTGTDAAFSCVILTPISATDGVNGHPIAIGPMSVVMTHDDSGVPRGLCKDAPAAPFTFTAGMGAVNYHTSSNVYGALFLIDTNAKKAIVFAWALGYFDIFHVDLSTNHLTKVGSFNSVYDYFLWMQIEHDGTNIALKFSSQNLNYMTLYSEDALAYLTTIDKVGFGAMTAGGPVVGKLNGQVLIDLWNWVEA